VSKSGLFKTQCLTARSGAEFNRLHVYLPTPCDYVRYTFLSSVHHPRDCQLACFITLINQALSLDHLINPTP